MASRLKAIDLFSGCGGFSLGLERAGIQVLAAVDFNPHAVQTYAANFSRVKHPLERDMTSFMPEELERLIGTREVDIIVGGPPCQGFSQARQVDGSNHGTKRRIEDKRRDLYKELLRFVDHFQPSVFIIENVRGVRKAEGGKYFAAIQHEARHLGRPEGKPGYRVHSYEENAWELGVPQKRRRQLIIGVRNDLPGYFPSKLSAPPRVLARTVLGAAISDLPTLRAGGGHEEMEYDLEKRSRAIEKYGLMARKYLFDVLEVGQAQQLTAHRARPHNDQDLRDFGRLKEGQTSKQARDAGIKLESTYNTEIFHDRYTRQNRSGPCSTIVAHLKKDGLMFIHPTQLRSLTPREAARIQSFPDWFRFPVAQGHKFEMIGNAVPPLVAEAIGLAAQEFIQKAARTGRRSQTNGATIPQNPIEALKWLVPMLDRPSRELRGLMTDELKRAWQAIAYLFPDLHPDSIHEHGKSTMERADGPDHVRLIEPRLLTPFYVLSGWPVALGTLTKEVLRRYKTGELSVDDFYCQLAQRAGLGTAVRS